MFKVGDKVKINKSWHAFSRLLHKEAVIIRKSESPNGQCWVLDKDMMGDRSFDWHKDYLDLAEKRKPLTYKEAILKLEGKEDAENYIMGRI